MKDTLITVSWKKRELYMLLACFLLANALNVYSIVAYNSRWKELYSSLWYVILVCLGIYGFLAFLRLAWWGLGKLLIKKPG
jgi:hypothetical protein